MPNINFIEIFKKSWEITWRNRFLWWFGFFATLGSLGSMNYSFDSSGNSSSSFEKSVNDQFQSLVANHLPWVITGVVLIFLLLIFFMVVGIIGRGALIKSTHLIAKRNPVDYKNGIKEGKKYFWKILKLGISLAFFIIATILILATPVIFLFISKSYVIGTILAIFAVLIFIPLIFIFIFLKEYGLLYLVLSDLRVFESIEKAYELFLKNILSSVIMLLLFLPLNLIFLFSIVLLFVPFAIIFAALGFLFYFLLGKIGVIIIVSLGILLFLACLLFIRSVFEVFSQTAWVLFFHEIASPKIEEEVAETLEEIEEESLPDVAPVKTAGTTK